VWAVPSDTRVCPYCAERIKAAVARCRHCQSDLPALSEQPSSEPEGDEEVLGREPEGSRGALIAVGGILVVILLAYGVALVVSSPRPQHHSEVFNMFAKVKDACEKDDGNVLTTDQHGTPMAFATPDGPERYWCVSRHYLTSIGHAPQDPPPPVRKVPSEYKWLWPRTSYGQ
jgi:hypothetical protein